MARLTHLVVLARFLALGAGGCGSAPAADGGTDATAADAFVADAGADAGSTADRCAAAARSLANACASRPDPTCAWGALEGLCATERADVILAGTDCLIDMNTPGACAAYPEPGGGVACVEIVHDNAGYLSAGEIADRIVGLCSTDGALSDRGTILHRLPVPLAVLGDDRLRSLDSCLDAAFECNGVRTCLSSAIPELDGCPL